mmetsp:Transcript_72168/g.121114  ORF Transcript_72168/g.121114 Transcript_72168/m.121114 type:complete len:407 (+) Transcript_72168:52-1272(+)
MSHSLSPLNIGAPLPPTLPLPTIDVSHTESSPKPLQSGLWWPHPDLDVVTAKWHTEGWSNVMKGVCDSETPQSWMMRGRDTIIAVLEGIMHCSLSRESPGYDLRVGDQFTIPAHCMHRMRCVSKTPCKYYMAYKLDNEDMDLRDASEPSYYTNARTKVISTPRGLVEASEGLLGKSKFAVRRNSPEISLQSYAIPMPNGSPLLGHEDSVDWASPHPEGTKAVPSFGSGSAVGFSLVTMSPRSAARSYTSSRSNTTAFEDAKWRRSELTVVVCEGLDLPNDFHRVNMAYKDQEASTKTKHGSHTATWNESFAFEGHDDLLSVELQGVGATKLNLDLYYDALRECVGPVTIVVPVPLTHKPLEESSRVKLELTAKFHRRESSANMALGVNSLDGLDGSSGFGISIQVC